jgi:integrase
MHLPVLGELAALRWSNIDLTRGEIRFVTAKTGRRMIIPLSEGLRSFHCPRATEPMR